MKRRSQRGAMIFNPAKVSSPQPPDRQKAPT